MQKGITDRHLQTAVMRTLLQSDTGDGSDAADNLSLIFELGKACDNAIMSSSAKINGFMDLWFSLKKDEIKLELENKPDHVVIKTTALYEKDEEEVGHATTTMLLDKQSLELKPADNFMQLHFDVSKFTNPERAVLYQVFKDKVKPSLDAVVVKP